jgi:CheY-like chemotaxis protein
MFNTTSKTTILMVEDDENDVYLFEREFIRLMDRIRVRRVKDGVEATEYLEGVGEYSDRVKYPLPGVILLDLGLPRINGLEFLEWLRSCFHGHNERTPVIVLSSSSLEADVQAASEAGANAFLTKPARWEHLLEQFQRLGIPLAGQGGPPEVLRR